MIVVVAGSWPEGAAVQVELEFGLFGPPVQLSFVKLFAPSLKLPVQEISQIEVLRDEGSPALAGLDDLRATASIFLSSKAAKGLSLVLVRASGDRAGLLKAQKSDLEGVMSILKAVLKNRSSAVPANKAPPAPSIAVPSPPAPPPPTPPSAMATAPATGSAHGARSLPARVGEIVGWVIGGPVLVALLVLISKWLAIGAIAVLAMAILAVLTGRLKDRRFGNARAAGAAYLALAGSVMVSAPTTTPSSPGTMTVPSTKVSVETQPQRDARLAREVAAREAQQNEKAAQLLAEQERARAKEIADYVERLESELAGIDRFKAEEFAGEPTSIVLAAAVFSAWARIYEDGGSLALTPAQERRRSELKRKVAATQVRAFPIYRRSYAQAANRAVWRQNMSVRARGASAGTISYTWVGFGNNANIEDFQRGVREAQDVLRFRRSEFRWYEGADRYHYYTLSAPADGELLIYDAGAFRPTTARSVPLGAALEGAQKTAQPTAVTPPTAPIDRAGPGDAAKAAPAANDTAVPPI